MGFDIDKIHRVRRQSVYDEWEQCGFCEQPFSAGWKFYISTMGSDSVCVCDHCLKTAKGIQGGWLSHVADDP